MEFIHACCVLHNLGNDEDLNILEPPNEEVGEVNEELMVEEITMLGEIDGENIRNTLCDDVARRTAPAVIQRRANSARWRRL